MRGPACFTNCSPAESQVTINANTYAIGANEIGWGLELFGVGGKPISSLPAGVDGLSFGIAGALPATYALKLAHPPVSPNAVQLTLKGTATQRPLVGLNGYASEETDAVMNAHDYFVIGSTVYITFAVDAATDTIYVRYQSMPGASAASAGVTGMMRYVTIPGVTPAAGLNIGHWPALPTSPMDLDEMLLLTSEDAGYGESTDDPMVLLRPTQFSTSDASHVFLVSDYTGATAEAQALADAVAYEALADFGEAAIAYDPETGWLKADGVSEYRINLYSALYAFLEDADLLETSFRATHFIITKISVPIGMASANLVLVKA